MKIIYEKILLLLAVIAALIAFIGVTKYYLDERSSHASEMICTTSLVSGWTYNQATNSCKESMLGTNGCYEFRKGEYHTEIECQKNSSVGNPAIN